MSQSSIVNRSAKFLKEKGYSLSNSQIEEVFSQINDPHANNKSIVHLLKNKLNIPNSLVYELLAYVGKDANWNVAHSKGIEFRELFNCGPYWRELENHLKSFFQLTGNEKEYSSIREEDLDFMITKDKTSPASQCLTDAAFQMMRLATVPNVDYLYTLGEIKRFSKKKERVPVSDILKEIKNLDYVMVKRLLICCSVRKFPKIKADMKALNEYLESGSKTLLSESDLKKVESLEKNNIELSFAQQKPIAREMVMVALPGVKSPVLQDRVDLYKKLIESALSQVKDDSSEFIIKNAVRRFFDENPPEEAFSSLFLDKILELYLEDRKKQ